MPGNHATQATFGRLAILYPGDLVARHAATRDNNRFSGLFEAFVERGVDVEPAVYGDEFCAQVRDQLMRVDGVLVWVNPLQDGRDRSVLDAMLRDVAATGRLVSAHPDIIEKLGTKEVLYRTREIGWGCDTQLYRSLDQLRRELPGRLAAGQARVLKQCRGNGGNGVWKVQLAPDGVTEEGRCGVGLPGSETAVHVRHARRGCSEERLTLGDFIARCEPYFSGNGRMIDQEYQPRLTEGMIRCYLVHGEVAGFGHQAINALFPPPSGRRSEDAPQPGPRLYHPATKPEFQPLKRLVEQRWVPAVQRLLAINTASLPILWDCDFLLGPTGGDGEERYVLCEINVSSVAPYPESAVPEVVAATVVQLHAARRRRGLAP